MVPNWRNLFIFLQEGGDTLKPTNQFSKLISEHIYIWIYVGLIKFETENCCCCGEALAAHSNGFV